MKADYAVPILTTSLIHFSLKGWENALFERGSERVKLVPKNSRAVTEVAEYRKIRVTGSKKRGGKQILLRRSAGAASKCDSVGSEQRNWRDGE